MFVLFIAFFLGRDVQLINESSLVASIMMNEAPQALDVLTAFQNKSVSMVRGSLETVVVSNHANTGVGPSTAPKEKKNGKKRDITTTSRSPNGTP